MSLEREATNQPHSLRGWVKDKFMMVEVNNNYSHSSEIIYKGELPYLSEGAAWKIQARNRGV